MPAGGRRGGIRRVVVVEDAARVQEAIGHVLRLNGFEVASARSGADGLAQVRTFMPDLVICDIQMPILDGLSLLRHLREDPETARVKVLLATAKGTDADVARGLEYGADGYLVKPFSSLDLLQAIAALSPGGT